MTLDNEFIRPIAELTASHDAEIAKFKRFESQRLGRDIGWAEASDKWFEKHFADWAHNQRRIIDEALSMTDESLGLTSKRLFR